MNPNPAIAAVRPAGDLTYPAPSPTFAWLSAISAGLGAYHGYKRNGSIGWALVWAASGAVLPVVTPAIAFAQGFGEPAR